MTKLIIFIIFNILFVNLVFSTDSNNEIIKTLEQNGLTHPFFKDLVVQEKNVRKDDRSSITFKTYTLTGKSNHYYYVLDIVEKIDDETGIKLTQLYSKSAISSYLNRKSPYTGEMATTMICPEVARPQVEEVSYYSNRSFVLVGNANDRNTIGVCDINQYRKKAIMFIGYNFHTKTFFNIRIFIPKSDYQKEYFDSFLKQFNKLML